MAHGGRPSIRWVPSLDDHSATAIDRCPGVGHGPHRTSVLPSYSTRPDQTRGMRSVASGRPWVSRWTETELRLGWERKSVTEFDRSTDMTPESKGRWDCVFICTMHARTRLPMSCVAYGRSHR